MFRAALAFVVGRALGLITTFVLARYFGSAAWGAVNTARVVTEIPLLIAKGGAEQLVFKSVAGRIDEIRETLSSMQVAFILFSTIFCLAYEISPGEKISSWGLLLYVFGTSALAAIQIKSVVESMTGNVKALYGEQITLQVVRLASAFALSFILGGFMSLSISYFFSVVFVLFTVSKGCWVIRGFSLKRIKEIIDLGSNYALAGLTSRIDMLIVSLLIGVSEAGRYSILVSMAALLNLVGQVQGRALAPIISRCVKDNKLEAASSVVATGQRIVLFLNLIAITLGVYLSDFAFSILGKDFQLTGWIVWAIFFSTGISVAFAYEGYLLSLSGRQAKERYVLVINSVVFSVLCIFSAIFFGLDGVGFSSVVCSILFVLLRRFSVVVELGGEIKSALTWRWRQYFSAFFVGALGIVGLNISKSHDALLSVLIIFLTIFGQFAIGWLGVLSSDDKSLIKSKLNY